jgi:undecaprenyl-diphosphatase
VRVFLVGVLAAYALIAAGSIALGLLVTRVIVANRAIGHDDEYFVRVLAHHRSSGLTEASVIGSIMAGGVALPILVAVIALAAACLKQWRVAAFVVFALVIESAAYRTTTLIVHRHRPIVHRLEQLPVNASYPSGHTAASIAVYCGLALLLTSRVTSKAWRYAIWAIAVAIPVFVALSRMYRGMHHPLDVLGGAVIGVATLALLLLVCRAAGIAAATKARSRVGA